MIDQFVNIDGKEYEVTDKKDMFMITIKSSFIGYITKQGEYLGKSLTEEIVEKLKEAIL
jgi:hypothetical protein